MNLKTWLVALRIGKMDLEKNLTNIGCRIPIVLHRLKEFFEEAEFTAFDIYFQNIDLALPMPEFIDDHQQRFRSSDSAIPEKCLMKDTDILWTRRSLSIKRMNFRMGQFFLHRTFKTEIFIRTEGVDQRRSIALARQTMNVTHPFTTVTDIAQAPFECTLKSRFPIVLEEHHGCIGHAIAFILEMMILLSLSPIGMELAKPTIGFGQRQRTLTRRQRNHRCFH